MYLRLIRPLIADESCVACHANANVGSVIGIMDISHSLEGVQKDISLYYNIYYCFDFYPLCGSFNA